MLPYFTLSRGSLAWRIFLGIAAVVTAVLATTLALTAIEAGRTADVSVDRALRATREQALQLLTARASTLQGGAEVFVQNSSFRALLPKRDFGSMLDQSQEAARQLGALWTQIIDANGVRLAKSDDPGAAADTLTGSALVLSALQRQPSRGFIVIGDSAVAQAVTVPIFQASDEKGAGTGALLGVLMAVTPVDSAVARRIRQNAQGAVDVAFFVRQQSGAARFFAGTLERTNDLETLIRDMPPAADAAPDDTTEARTAMRTNPMIGGEHYVALAEPLRSASGAEYGGLLILRNRDAEFAAFRRLRNTILFGGIAGLLLAALAAAAVARQITRPVGALVEATRRAADGDYAADITVSGADEIGRLADAIRAMLHDLREKHAMVAFLSGGATADAMTVQLAQMRSSIQQAARDAGVTPGTRFAGRYDVKEVLGVGGMGSVFKAMDTELGEVIAIKTLRHEFLNADPSALERFKSEIRLARRISHRNVVRTHDLGEHSGVYFITMEYVEGTSLKQLIRDRGRLPLSVALAVGKQLCRALEVAHEQGVIHRDIKPANIVVEPDGVIKVMDFGIARLAAKDSGMTQAGMLIGTPAYMAPEQLMGSEIDGRADLYAAGCVLYECLTGHPPHESDSAITLIAKVFEETPKPPSGWNDEVPPALDGLVMRLLSTDRDGRPSSAAALHDLLASIG
ncbi:MAG: protein kinase [Gemmatimonadetes bacterium]|nr:protein kinase [Gemmatimonadota bacterium]